MRPIATTALLIAAAAFAQTAKDKYMTPGTGGSPPMQASTKFGDKEVWIVYHAPSVKGRKIFGSADALQKPGTTWRMGADQATFLHTDADLDINGLTVPKGEYTLFADLDEGKWQLIVSKQTGQWGIKRNGAANVDEAQVLGKAPLTMSKPAAPVEQMKIALAPAGSNKAKLTVAWENVEASANVTAK
jgi:Protein of unknown function (DUF2911)